MNDGSASNCIDSLEHRVSLFVLRIVHYSYSEIRKLAHRNYEFLGQHTRIWSIEQRISHCIMDKVRLLDVVFVCDTQFMQRSFLLLMVQKYSTLAFVNAAPSFLLSIIYFPKSKQKAIHPLCVGCTKKISSDDNIRSYNPMFKIVYNSK